MNKYEDALDWFNGNKGWIDPYEFPEEYQELLEDMLKREIPMKPVKGTLCGKCNSFLVINGIRYHRCLNLACEQLVDWSDQDER